MSNYVKTVDFAAKDALASGNPNKVALGTQVDTEFNNIASAIATKEDTANKGANNGYASLNSDGEVPVTQISEDSVTQYEAALTILESQITDGSVLARVAGTETISASWTFTARPAFNGGTSGSSSPFTVDSTEVVTNLNADLLDGNEASAFATASHNHSASAITSGTLPVARGGTGTTSSTGTGSVVLSASPTFTGTVTAATINATTITGNGSGLTNLDAGDIASGTLAIARGGTGNTSGLARNISGKSGTAKTLSTSAPSGGSDGDIWYRYS